MGVGVSVLFNLDTAKRLDMVSGSKRGYFFGGVEIKIQVCYCDGMRLRVGVRCKSSKRQKSSNLGDVRPLYEFKGVLCGCVGDCEEGVWGK